MLLLGVTYKPDIADQRESPARPLARSCSTWAPNVRLPRPARAAWGVRGQPVPSFPDVSTGVDGFDLVLLALQHHSVVDFDAVVRHAKAVLDTRGRLIGSQVVHL